MDQQKHRTPLQEIYLGKLNEVLQWEKSIAGVFKKLGKAAYTDELSSALAPTSTYVDEHVQRLKLVIKLTDSQTKKGEVLVTPPAIPDLKLISRKKSFINDVTLVSLAMETIYHKVILYDFINKIAQSLEDEQACSLLGQSLAEDKDTYGWLGQLLGNVILPELKAEESVEAEG